MNFLQRAAVAKGVGDPVYVASVTGDSAASELITFMTTHGYALQGRSSGPVTGVFMPKQKHTGQLRATRRAIAERFFRIRRMGVGRAGGVIGYWGLAQVGPPQKWWFGFEPAKPCAILVSAKRLAAGEWKLQLRLPPVYCVRMHLGVYNGDALDIPGVGTLDETPCPNTAYPHEPQPDILLNLKEWGNVPAREGTVALNALDEAHTRFLVHANMDKAWIAAGSCATGILGQRRVGLRLNPFYSFRSDTIVRLPLRSLLQKPHVVLVDVGGAHGGDPVGCADIVG